MGSCGDCAGLPLAWPQPCVRLTPSSRPWAQQRAPGGERVKKEEGAEPCGVKSQVWTSDSPCVHRLSTAAHGMPRRCRRCVSRGEMLFHGPAWGSCWAQRWEKSRCGAPQCELIKWKRKGGFCCCCLLFFFFFSCTACGL